MSYFTYILCPSAEPVGREDIAEFVNDGVYFEEDPTYDPTPSIGSLGRLSILYETGRPPIAVERLQGDESRAAIDEALDATRRARVPARDAEELRELIRRTRDVIRFEIDRDTLTDDAWTMLDALEAHLMKRCTGLLYAYEDGFYNQQLQPVASIKK
jgi:hypothetical protein